MLGGRQASMGESLSGQRRQLVLQRIQQLVFEVAPVRQGETREWAGPGISPTSATNSADRLQVASTASSMRVVVLCGTFVVDVAVEVLVVDSIGRSSIHCHIPAMANTVAPNRGGLGGRPVGSWG